MAYGAISFSAGVICGGSMIAGIFPTRYSVGRKRVKTTGEGKMNLMVIFPMRLRLH